MTSTRPPIRFDFLAKAPGGLVGGVPNPGRRTLALGSVAVGALSRAMPGPVGRGRGVQNSPTVSSETDRKSVV